MKTIYPYKRESLRSKTVRGKIITLGLDVPFTRKAKTLHNITEKEGVYSKRHDEYVKKNPSALAFLRGK